MTQSKLTSSKVAQRVLDSLKSCCRSVSSTSRQALDDRTLRYESLEERCVLSANALGADITDGNPTDSQFVTTESFQEKSGQDGNALTIEQTEFTSITVRVNDEVVKLKPTGGALELSVGDKFEVVSVAFDSNASQGIFALEAYVNKIQDDHSASLIDYNDGRFSMIADNFAANGVSGAINGISGGWVAEAGWDRLSIALVHYMEKDTAVVSRALIQLDVGQPDFAFDEQALSKLQYSEVRVGEAFDIYGAWSNNGKGNFHNYAEVDIYHESNPDQIVWAGALVGNASAENRVEGYFVNNRSDDNFSEVFTPEREGGYYFRFYLDPEHVVSESNEANNRFDVKVNVLPANSTPVANADAVKTRMNETLDRIDVLANDFDSDADSLAVAEVSKAQHGKVEINDDGTLSYTPNHGFVGTDRFQYSVTDGNAVSDFATVQVEVLPNGFSVSPFVNGDEDTRIAIQVEADSNKFSHVRVSNVPDGAVLSHGKHLGQGSYDVKVKDVDSLTVTPPRNSDASFELTLTPVQKGFALVELSQTVSVSVNAVADGGQVDVADFAIVTGASGSLPFRFSFGDLDGSEQHSITFDGLPDFISLSAGERVGNSWVLQYEDLAGLQIRADRVSETTGFNVTDYGLYQRFDVSVTVRSVEQSNGSYFEDHDKFTFLAIQRI